MNVENLKNIMMLIKYFYKKIKFKKYFLKAYRELK